MQNLHLSALSAFYIFSFPAFAEIVQTNDGRSIELKDDGTFEFIKPDSLSDSEFVEYQTHFFTLHEGEYGEKKVLFMPIYKNVSNKKIIAVKFKTQFFNAFGEEIFAFSGDLNEAVAPNQSSTSSLHYYFEDNQFIPGEPYDKLLPMVTNQSGSVKVTLNMIAFDSGEIVKISN